MKIAQYGCAEAIQQQKGPNFSTATAIFSRHALKKEPKRSAIDIILVQKLQNNNLITYVAKRGINISIIQSFCSIAHWASQRRRESEIAQPHSQDQ